MPDWTAVFPILKKISQQFQGRIERLKNERCELNKQLAKLGDHDSTISTAIKKAKILVRLDQLNDIIGNNAKD